MKKNEVVVRSTLPIILCSTTKLSIWRSKLFIKEKLKDELLKLSHIATKNQVALCLIKELSSIDLVRLCDKIDLMNIFCLF
jgi:hypothetical protein